MHVTGHYHDFDRAKRIFTEEEGKTFGLEQRSNFKSKSRKDAEEEGPRDEIEPRENNRTSDGENDRLETTSHKKGK